MMIDGVTPYYHDTDSGIAIYHGDCRELLPLLPDSGVDLILTDPPYGHNNNNGDLASRLEYATGKGIPGPPRPIANDLVQYLFSEARRLLGRGRCCCCCCGGGGPDPQFARWSLWLDESVGFKQAIVWDKGDLARGWHYRRTYEFVLVGQKPGATRTWNSGHRAPTLIRWIPGIALKPTEHPTPKPVALMRHFVYWHANPGDLVLDPLMGAGTTLVAARLEGRRAIGIEIEERYCEMAARRLGQEAFDFGGGEKPPSPRDGLGEGTN